MHRITHLPSVVAFPACKLNPAALSCTCKGFRMISLCSHVIATTCEYIVDADCQPTFSSYSRDMLDMMLQKLVNIKPAAHRPRATLGGTRIQPNTDEVPDEEEDEEEDIDSDYDDI